MALERSEKRKLRQSRVRRKAVGNDQRPRLSVFRSGLHIYAQIIDDAAGNTLAAASTIDKALKGSLKTTANIEAAKAVGKLIAQRAVEKGIKYDGEHILRKEGKKK